MFRTFSQFHLHRNAILAHSPKHFIGLPRIHIMAALGNHSEVQRVHNLFDELLSVFDVYKSVLRANTVDFYTDDRVEILRDVNPTLLTELLSLSSENLLNVACGNFKSEDVCNTTSVTEDTFSEVQKLSDQVSRLRCERLDDKWFFNNAASYIQSHRLNQEADNGGVIVKPKGFMNLKKSHEVAEMSLLCSSLIKSNKLNQVIDIGSGKGYLSQYLTLQYGVRVTGIDSSATNTHGAKERSRKLTKHWKTFMRRAVNEKNDADAQMNIESETTEPGSGSDVVSDVPDSMDQPTLIDIVADQSSVQTTANTHLGVSDNASPGPTQIPPGENGASEEAGSQGTDGQAGHFRPVTAFVNSSTDLSDIARGETSNGMPADTEMEPFLLVGLHTCGDLASTLTRLFVDCPTARAVCYVPCCYHFVSEEFEPTSSKFYIHPMEPGYWGFPMSEYIRAKNSNIGRDAKMLACMAQERMAVSREMPVRSLFYRAVLQVLLKDHYRIPTRQESVGKLAHKSSDFVDYTRKALKRLNFDVNKLSDETIDQYHTDHLDKMHLLHAFTAARLAFSRMVESLLLLDKLCYLLEQPNIGSAAIVRLFDPVQSPRCYAIVATKDRTDTTER